MSASADLQQLVEAALASDRSSARAGKRKMCVQREFDTPLKQTVEEWQIAKSVSPEWYAPLNGSDEEMPHRLAVQIEKRLQRAVEDSLGGRAQVTRSLAISSVPKPLVLYSSNQSSECRREMPKALEPPKPNGPEEVFLTRPVFADGFALIEYANFCGGLCYGSSLRVFQKQNGKWTYVAWKPLAVG